MSRKKVIVKRLNAIQNFGAMDVLCTDKTGTLTQDRIILQAAPRRARRRLRRGAATTPISTAIYQIGLKNLLDVAVLKHVELAEHLKVQSQATARSTRCRSTSSAGACRSCVGRDDGDHRADLQGRGRGGVRGLHRVCRSDGETRRRSTRATSPPPRRRPHALNADGFRVVAVAYKEIAAGAGRLLGRRRSRPDAARLSSPSSIRRRRRAAAAIAALEAARRARSRSSPATTTSSPRKICREVGLPVERHPARQRDRGA